LKTENFKLFLAALGLLTLAASGQEFRGFSGPLPRNRFTSGEETLQALAPVSEATRYSIVKLNVEGATVALGTVMDTNGMVLTKASEIRKGKLTCWLADGREVEAELLGVDQDEDVALVRVRAGGLKPIEWATGGVSVGQWAITPGIAETPHAIGIISALPRRIRPHRAFIGVQFDFDGTAPKVREILPGLGAEKAGIKPGDTIVAVNDTAVTNREQVVEMLREFRDGQTVKLGVRRERETFDAHVQMMAPTSRLLGSSFNYQQRLDRLAGEVSQRAEGFEQAIEHDTVLQPWLCGGPLVNLDGKAVGINIARASRVTTYALPPRLANQILEEFRARAKIGSDL